ncbi:hypothetical protein FT641_19130 [Bacillus paranthracis]|uniref:hypothetical protein n=1 Tax=Bacillus paranthracis TaxID=2026186 RepID=UPI001879207D|nr:hypothetical protein [Bacillus paranthracis]MBE7114320.1 hypothetical protein [Bacillus paranthracis]MBE7154807.1 hypothetical protein [Bacillus paranthracis]
MVKRKEVLASSCGFGTFGTEVVEVLLADCPIHREETATATPKYAFREVGEDNPIIHECKCIAWSGLEEEHKVPKCPHYKGVTKVQRDKQKRYKVDCAAVQG